MDSDLTEAELISILVQLAVLEVTVPALLETGAGKVVRKLKGREGKVGRLAGRLVIRWKKVVLNYNPTEEEQEENIGVHHDQVETETKADTSRDLLNQTGLEQDHGGDYQLETGAGKVVRNLKGREGKLSSTTTVVEVTRRIMTMVVTLFDERWMWITRRISTSRTKQPSRGPRCGG